MSAASASVGSSNTKIANRNVLNMQSFNMQSAVFKMVSCQPQPALCCGFGRGTSDRGPNGFQLYATYRHCEPTGRANARPMTGSAKQSRPQRKTGLLTWGWGVSITVFP